MTENTSNAPATTQHESAQSALLAGVSTPARQSKPATPARKRQSATSRKPAQSKPAQRSARASKPATPARQSDDDNARTASQRKVSVMSAMIMTCADAVRTDASYARFVKSARSAGIDLSDVKRDEARAMLSARLSYAPGDFWDDALNAPTVLQAGKRSKIARVAAQTRVTRAASRKSSASKPAQSKSTPARKPAQRKSA